MLKKFLIFAICIGICFIIFFFYQQAGNRPEHKETASRVYDYHPSTGLPPQETQMLLKHFNSKVAAREANLTGSVTGHLPPFFFESSIPLILLGSYVGKVVICCKVRMDRLCCVFG